MQFNSADMVCFRQGKLFYVTSTTVTSTHTTSTLCFMKRSCDQTSPFALPGRPASLGATSKTCATGCGCVPLNVVCPTAPAAMRCTLPGELPQAPPVAPALMPCPAGCVQGPLGPIPDPCNSCTVTNSMADMMIPPCPGRKKKRAILESALFEGFNISPSPSSQADIKR